MQSFEDIGLREELLRTLEEEPFGDPTSLQRAVIPALRRGGNLAARASAGSGKTLAYTLGVLDGISATAVEGGDEQPSMRVLVLAATPGQAEGIGLSMVPFAQSVDLPVSVLGTGWGTTPDDAAIVVADAATIMRAVRASEIKLDRLEAIVVDGASAILELGDWEKVDALLDLIPRDAQRVVFSASFPEPVEDLIARRVKRALRYPAEPAIADGPSHQPGAGGVVGFVIASVVRKLAILTQQLRARNPEGPPPTIFCRDEERAAELTESLTVRGFLVGAPGDDDADVAIAADPFLRKESEADLGQTISFDVPPDVETLRARHEGDPDAIVLLEPRELAHLREVAQQAGFEARSTPLDEVIPAVVSDLDGFRTELRKAILEEDLSAQMLILEPLLDEFTATEVAAATAAILRRRRPRDREAEARAGDVAPSRKAEAKSPSPGAAPVTWARLFVSIGSRDDVGPGDLVGAFAGEADIPGSRIGKIEIRDSFSIVEIQADVAEKVIRAVNGTTLKGRSLRVDFDRGGPLRRPPVRGSGSPRRATRRPPQGDR
ncbi:MAG: DEAD/DEAH box helicase [Gemmatimonas sp.]|nr:DEAD/DEAH box helicase [Gemmatimonas sp.]